MATPIGEAVAVMEVDTSRFEAGVRNVEVAFAEASAKLDQRAKLTSQEISQSLASAVEEPLSAWESKRGAMESFFQSAMVAPLGLVEIAADESKEHVLDLAEVFDEGTTSVRGFEEHLEGLETEARQVNDALNDMETASRNAFEAMETDARNMNAAFDEMRSLQKDLGDFGESSGSAMSGAGQSGGGGISGGKLRTGARGAFALAGLASVALEGRGGAFGESVSTIGQFAQAGGGIGMMAGPQGAAIGIATGAVVGLVKAISDLGDESSKAMEALEKSSAGAAIRSATRRIDEAMAKAEAAGVDEGMLQFFRESKEREMEFLGKARGFAEKDPTNLVYGVDQIMRRGRDFEARLSAQTLAASKEFQESVSPEKIMAVINARKESEANRKLEELSTEQLRVLIEIKSKPDPIATVG